MNCCLSFLHGTWRVLFWPLWIFNFGLALWCAGCIWYPRWGVPCTVKIILLCAFLLGTCLLLLFCLKTRWLLGISLLLSFVVLAAWLHLRPTGQLDWDPPFAKMPVARFSPDGKTVTIENIRDFHYRTEDDYDVRYRTETYNLDDIVSMDYSITHWNHSTLFGHIMLSFEFKDGRRLAFSPEARMTRDKRYEILPGFFRQYELIFIVATEEDVFQLRTHHRKYEFEEVLLYPTTVKPETATFLLKDLLLRGNDLIENPEFYNGLFYNCLSSMAPTAQKIGSNFCNGLRGTFNGLSDKTGYRNGFLRRDKSPDEPFEEYQKRHLVNRYVENLVDPENYSQLIRMPFHPEKEK